MTGERCAHCNGSMRFTRRGARYCSAACRTAAWRQRKASQNRHAPMVRRRRTPELRVSYRKARTALVDALWHFPGAEVLVDDALRSVLTPRQRAHLDQDAGR